MPVEAAVIEESVDASCANSVLGLRPWYRGIVTRDSSGSCTIGKIALDDDGNTKLAGFVWVIILNLMYDASLVSSLVATGFIIWGGYKVVLLKKQARCLQKMILILKMWIRLIMR